MGELRPKLLVLMTVIALAAGMAAQEAIPLTLPEAVKSTLANNPMHKVALADTKAAWAGVREARARMLPRITFAENFTAGNDPVFVFGTKLRQQEFTARDLAFNSLNPPTPIVNYASRFFGQWNLFDSTQSWKALDRAKYLNRAAAQQLDRTDQELVFQTVQADYGVLLAAKQLEVAEDAMKTVAAIEQQSRACPMMTILKKAGRQIGVGSGSFRPQAEGGSSKIGCWQPRAHAHGGNKLASFGLFPVRVVRNM